MGGPASAFPLTQTLLNIYSRRSASPDVPQEHNQKTRYDPRNVDEQLPPPPSPPQIKEPIQLDGISRPNSVERVLHPDTQHNLANHDALNKLPPGGGDGGGGGGARYRPNSLLFPHQTFAFKMYLAIIRVGYANFYDIDIKVGQMQVVYVP
ncbi:hypothetical protein PV325_010987 [Microctonus aethiopoides]|nr:hypothetical protein PV325_010987 [Microctonus aethiopoides]KAK0094972.1 hypothetical protein PV326_009534 [Microctonus aethiopoides]